MEKDSTKGIDSNTLTGTILNLFIEKGISYEATEKGNSFHFMMKNAEVIITVYVSINNEENIFNVFALTDKKVDRTGYLSVFEKLNEINEENNDSSLLIDFQSGCLASTISVFTDGPITDSRYLFGAIEACADSLGENVEILHVRI